MKNSGLRRSPQGLKAGSLKRKTAMARGSTPSSSASGLRRSQPKRDWSEARAKVEREGECRLKRGLTAYTCEGKLEAAHVVGRACDNTAALSQSDGPVDRPWSSRAWPVAPDRIAPLCSKHHKLYDAHEIDLLPVLSLDEQIQAVRDADGLENARRRLAPSQYRSST